MSERGKGERMSELIHFLAERLAQGLASGQAVGEAMRSAEVAVRAEFGGERIYVKSLPKQKRAVQLARLNLRTTRELAVATGIPERTVRRLTTGK